MELRTWVCDTEEKHQAVRAAIAHLNGKAAMWVLDRRAGEPAFLQALNELYALMHSLLQGEAGNT